MKVGNSPFWNDDVCVTFQVPPRRLSNNNDNLEIAKLDQWLVGRDLTTDLSISLLFCPNGDEDAATHAKDTRQLPQRPHASISGRQVTLDDKNYKRYNDCLMNFYFRLLPNENSISGQSSQLTG